MIALLSGHELGTALVRSLSSIVPARAAVDLSADGATVCIIDSSTASVTSVLIDLHTFGDADGLTVAQAVTAVSSVMSTLQDVVCEALTQPWPQSPTGTMALPDAVVDGGWIVARFSVAGDDRIEVGVIRVGPPAGPPLAPVDQRRE